MATEILTREVVFNVRHAPAGELFSVKAGVPAREASELASYLMSYIQARTFALGDETPESEEYTALHFLASAAAALYDASLPNFYAQGGA